MSICPFCKCDPFHYVDVGVGYVAVAVDCCDLGIELYSSNHKRASQVLKWMRSYSPKNKAKAMKILREEGLRK